MWRQTRGGGAEVCHTPIGAEWQTAMLMLCCRVGGGRRRQPGSGVRQFQRNWLWRSGRAHPTCGGLAERTLPVAVLSDQDKEGWARALGGSNVLIMMRQVCHRHRLRSALQPESLARFTRLSSHMTGTPTP